METFKEIDIKYYDNSGNVQVRCTVPVTQDALVHYELMQSHYCKLSFKLSKPIYFLLGDFIDTPYGRFELIDLTKVKDNDTIGYSYEIQFDAYYRKLKNKILKYRPNTGSQEATFSLTSKISTHVELIMKSLAYYAKLDKSYLYDPKFIGEGTDYTYVIDASVDAKAAKLITYSNSNMLDAIANIAQTFDCEWWFEGNILHFGTCENTNAIVDFKLDDNIVSMSSSQNQSTYANRVYAFGAARNLPSGYKNDADADITKDGVVEKRLMLPTSAECSDKNKQLLTENGFELKNGYIQVSGLREDQYVEGVTTNDDIYPRNLIKTSNVASYEKDVEDESTPEEGDLIKRTFYRVGSLTIIGGDGEKTGDMAFRKSYILSGKSLHIVFQSGSLNGMDFECEFNPDGVEEILKDKDGNPILKDGKEQINPKSQVFEIIANEDYGRFLPDITLHPKDRDTFVLYNWDSTKLGNTLVSSASNELLTDAIKNLKKSMIDPTTHTCTAEANYSYNQGRGNLHGVGDRVNLYNKGYGDSYRSSRVIGYEFCLDIPYDGAKYYVGEKPSYSRLNAMESKIEELVYNGQSYLNNGGGSGGSSIYIIKSYDKTSPTEYNVYSARAVYKSFLSKLTDDTAEGLITFAKGLVAKGLADLMMGARFGNNAMITELGEAVFSAIKSLDYDNAAEQGFSVEKEKNGKYHAFFTNLTIWGKAIFHEIEVRKLSYSGGNIYLSGAGSKLIKVVPVKQSVSADGATSWVETTEDDVECVGWKCYLLADDGTTATMNDWQEGDQARCQTMGEIVSGGTYQNASNKSYWRTIPDGGVSTQNEKIYGSTKMETYLDEDGNEQTRDVQVELYGGQAFAWIVVGKHGDLDGYTNENSEPDENSAPVETSGIPAEGDTIVLDGNRHRNKHGEYDKTDRQNVIILETTGEYAPRIACYANISEYKHTITKSENGSDKEVSLSVFETSPKGGTKINSSRFEWISEDGSTINIINYRGDWVSTNTYHKNDQVNHNNAVWVCVANSGVSVKEEEPSDGSSYWKKVLSGGKGEKGDKGDDGLSGNGIVPAYVRSKDNPTLPTSTDKNNLDNGWSLAIPSVTDVKNVSYSDSSWTDYNDGSYTWKKSPTTANNSTSWCLVTFTTTQANQAVKFVIKSFSEPRYDYIFLSEIDASVVPPKPDYKGASRAVSGNGVELSITDVVAIAGTHTVYICYGKDASGDYNGDYGLFRIESMAGIPLWQSNGKEVFTREDGGTTKSKIESWSEPFRVTGENGEDAVSYTVTLTRGSNGITQGLYVGVTRYIGTACTTGTIIDFGMSCKAYTDGTLAEGLTDRLQTSDSYIDFAAFPKAKSFTVELLDKNGNKVATGNYSSGDDAISILVEDAPLVFDTDDSGTVPVNDTKTAKVKVMRGNTNVTNDCNQESSRDDLSSNCMCEVKKDKDNECISVSVQGRWIVKNDVIVEGVNQGKVSTTSGYAVAQFVYDSVVYFAQVPFSVNVAKFTGVVAFNNKQYESKFTEISTKFGQDLADAESRITQTAREISLSVSEKSVGRRNMLIGSACRKYGDGFVYMSGWYYDGYPLEQIEKNSGINGVNCIHCRTKQTGTSNFYLSGFRWHGVSPQGNIKLERGKNYVLSFYAKTHTPNDIYFMAEVLYQGSKIDTSRPDGYAGPTGHSTTFSASEVDKWELFTVKVSVPSDAPYEYVEINIFARARSYSFVGGYICKPMLEEGENYNGWTLSEQDYDYVGGNLLDNARTLDRSGTLITINDTVIQNGYGTDSACAKSLMKANATLSDYKEVLRWIFGSTYLVNGNDYIFSFVAKADVDDARVVCYMWSGDIENSCDIFTEGNGGTWDSRSDGNVVFILSRQWTRYWVHWRPKDGYATPKEVIIRHTGNNSTSASTVYVTQPKLEIGATMTEYTERKSDLVDKASLKAAGIEITSDQVILYGNKVQVKNPKENPSEGYDEAAMFQNGKLNAKFINAGDIVAEGIKTQELEAQNLNVTGNSRLGIFEIHKAEIDERDEYTINGDSIKYSGSYKFPDGKTEAIGAGSFLTYKPMFVRQGGPDSSEYMRLGHQFTEWGDCNISGENKNYLFVGAAARYVCSGDTYSCNRTVLPSYLKYYSEFKPAAYIYSIKTSQDDPAFAIKVVKPEGSSGECTAIQTNAAIRGVFAPNTADIYKDRQIPNGVGVVYCSNDSDMTLTLPDSPVDGQTLIIIQGSSGKVYIAPPNGKEIHFGGSIKHSSDIGNNRFWSGTRGQFNILVFINDAWQLQFVNNRP